MEAITGTPGIVIRYLPLGLTFSKSTHRVSNGVIRCYRWATRKLPGRAWVTGTCDGYIDWTGRRFASSFTLQFNPSEEDAK